MPANGAEKEARSRSETKPTPRAGASISWAGVRVRLRTLGDLDRRTRAAQEAFALRDALVDDLGGSAAISTAQSELIDSAALMGAIVKDAATSYLAGRPVDLSELMALVNTQRRVLVSLGLERKAKNVSPSVDAYLAGPRGVG